MPNSATPELKEFARQLLDHEAWLVTSTGARGAGGFRVCEKLRQTLSKSVGAGGFQALFARALVLARAGVPWLAALQVKTDGSLEGLGEVEAKLDKNEIAAGEVALVAQLLGLLVTFIGPGLTLGLVREAWPRAAFNETNFGEGEKL